MKTRQQTTKEKPKNLCVIRVNAPVIKDLKVVLSRYDVFNTRRRDVVASVNKQLVVNLQRIGNPKSNFPRHSFQNVLRPVESLRSTVALPPPNAAEREIINALPAAQQQIPQPRRRHAAIPRRVTWRLGRINTAAFIEHLCARQHHCGQLNEKCQHCGALFFTSEPKNRQGIRLGCCKNGSYSLPDLGACPPSIKRLYTGDDERSVEFRNKIRFLNSHFAMASFKTSRPSVEMHGQGHWCFMVRGQVYHFTQGVPDTENLNMPQLQHYYFLDVAEALQHRRAFVENRVNTSTLETVETALRSANRYVRAYETMGEVLREERLQGRHDVDDMMIGIVSKPNINDMRKDYNLPESRSDIAAVFWGTEPPFNVDLRLYSRSRAERDDIHHELKNLNPMADPMVYPLLFPCGDNGYSLDMTYRFNDSKGVTLREFYRFRIQIREAFSAIHYGGKLLQQYLVDAWNKVETNLLWWVRQNQEKFRRAALQRENETRRRSDETEEAGPACILPASFYGGERHRHRQFLDAMAVIGKHGKPDLFVTFTCNPRWPEITENLQYGQKWEDRPDLVCRVFHVKFMEFMDDVVHKQLYGVVLNYHYVIEFQKRGLPHAHILITFIDDDKLLDSDSVDSIISATIPDRLAQPLLYQRVGDYQIHKPCGSMNPNAPCMRNNKCGKSYPKNFIEETTIAAGDKGRPEYKRPRDGKTISIPGTHLEVTNRRIVPYNPSALAKFASHINFEVVGPSVSLKYLFKYVSKGPEESATTASGGERREETREFQRDEVKKYLDCRHISSMEAAWRLLEFKMSDRSHAVLVLPVHLPGENVVSDEMDDSSQDIDNRLNRPSKLEAWFELNRISPEARRLKYVEVPEHYTWEGRTCRWVKRRQVAKMIGCIAEVGPSPEQLDKHHLRILLCHVKGATSFEHLRTVDGSVLPSFEDACRALNFVEIPNEYEVCLTEAAVLKNPRQLRRLFALICCVVSEERLAEIPYLWRIHHRHFIVDFLRTGMTVRAALLAAVEDIGTIVYRNRETTLATLGISVDDDAVQCCTSRFEEHGDATAILETGGEDAEEVGPNPPPTYDPSLLNFEQKKVFLRVLRAITQSIDGVTIPAETLRALGDEVITSVENLSVNERRSVFYLDGPGGTGKTYLYNTLLTVLRNDMRQNTVAVAYTGIAASLLISGTTVHKAFRLPLDLTDEAVAGWSLQHSHSKFLKTVALIVWDEAPMTPKLAVEAVDRYLREVTGNTETPFGGKIILFGGDFRQILPVAISGGRSEILNSMLKRSLLWSEFVKMQLVENMRAGPETSPDPLLDHNTFGNWLLQLGEGRLPNVTIRSSVQAPIDLVEIPTCILSPTFEDLLSFVYEGDYTSAESDFKAVLCTTNTAVDKVNSIILDRIPVEGRTYISVDDYKKIPGTNFHVTMDVLNSINSPSLPPHELTLKVGAIVILLRNIDVDVGLCNGTRLRVTALHEHVIECETISSHRAGLKLWLPKIKMSARDMALPLELIRTQFPVKLAFAFTINKSQGQTLTKVGVYLNRPCFAHGHLYVAFSRVGRRDQLRVFVEDGTNQGTFKFRGRKVFTRNVVYQEVWTDDRRPLPTIRTNPAQIEDVNGVVPSRSPYRASPDPWDVEEDIDD